MLKIDAFSQGRLKDKSVSFSARNMGKNDLWIAATTDLLQATLMTTDKDLDHFSINIKVDNFTQPNQKQLV